MEDLSQERGAVSQFVKFNVLRGFGGYLRSHVSLAPGSRERPADHAHTHAHSHTLALSQAGVLSRPLAGRLGAAPSRGAKARSHLLRGAKG